VEAAGRTDMPPTAEQMRERAERAVQARERAEEMRVQKAQKQLEALKLRWAEADAGVKAKRDGNFNLAQSRVAAWETKRQAALGRITKADEVHIKKMATSWTTKQKRFSEWREQVEAEAEHKAALLARSRSEASGRFAEEQRQTSARLEEAQRQADRRREAKAEEDRQKRAEAAELAFKRSEEAWQARVRVDVSRQERQKELAAECERKAKQAEECLHKRKQEVEVRLENRLKEMRAYLAKQG